MSLVHLYESKAVRLCSFVGVSKEFYREFAAVLRMAHARAYSGVSGATVCARDVAAGATGVANHYDLRLGELRSGARLERAFEVAFRDLKTARNRQRQLCNNLVH